ncbi:MAG: glycosyltransferase family 39 protein [Variibacter sp.]|nr:glycosyltransferase family 39 protein [Variibacter sp.]
MSYVSLIVEILRARPAAVFWVAALAQAALWVLVPALFYTSPPGELAAALAIGQAHQLGSWRGPPLAFWFADFAFKAAGGRVIGVYILAQLCVLAALWAVFALGRAMVGAQHAAMAVLLMGGILVLSAPTPEFGPAILALPLTALCLLHYWRAVGEGRRNAWIAVAVTLGWLLLTSYWGLLLALLLALFTLATRAGRAALASIDPWAAGATAALIALPHAVWLLRFGGWAALGLVGAPADIGARLARWPLLLAALLGAHAGLIALVGLASRWRSGKGPPAPKIARPGTPALARPFVLFFALAMPLAGALALALAGGAVEPGFGAPLALMSGLAVVVSAGEHIVLHRQRVLGVVWLALLLAPPLAVAAACLALPWTGLVDLSSRQPVAAMAQFFGDTFRRRTGGAPAIVVGDSPLAYALAASLPDRPPVFNAEAPAQTPWLSEQDVRSKGAIAVWPLVDPAGEPPPAIRARFPDLVAEVPQSFARPIEGVLPALRVGWGLIRPQAPAAQGR